VHVELTEPVLIILLLLLSALFSATETALIALGPAGIQSVLEDERRKSRLLLLWKDKPSNVLAGILIANNLVNILASVLATRFAGNVMEQLEAPMAAQISVAVGVGVMTFLIVTFGEIIPKTIARHSPKKVVLFFPFTYAVCFLLKPFVSSMSRFVKIFSKEQAFDKGIIVTEAEVEAMIKYGSAQGTISKEKRQLLSSVIEFSQTMTKEILVPRTEVIGFPCDASLEEVLRIIAEKKFSRYPVFDNDLDSIVGIVTVKDILRFIADSNRKPFNLREIVSTKVLIVPETKRIGELLREFQAQRVQMAVAVDEFGGTAGIVTTEDVVEEIVGEIYDEYEKAEELAKPISDGVYLVQGRAPIEVLSEIFGVGLPEQDNYETIGGLVMTHAGRVPQVGEAIEYFGLRFETRERTRTRVLSLLVSKVNEAQDG
jgi:putative hemolysin